MSQRNRIVQNGGPRFTTDRTGHSSQSEDYNSGWINGFVAGLLRSSTVTC